MNWEAISALGQLAIGAASFMLAIAVLFYTRKTVALESLRSVRDSWMQLDQMALSDPHNLQAADQLFNPGAAYDQAAARRRWIAYMALNPVVSDYMAAKARLLPEPDQTLAACRVLLGALLRDPAVYTLTQTGAYEGGFAQLCRDVHAQIACEPLAMQAASPATSVADPA